MEDKDKVVAASQMWGFPALHSRLIVGFYDANTSLQTAQPRFRWPPVAVFLAVIITLGFVSYRNQGFRRFYYGALSAGAALALMVQYRRERAIVSNRLVTVGVVTGWRKPLQSRSRFVNAIFSRLAGNIPLIKYSFVAFDQKTYTGETGWGARELYVGARIPVLYNSHNPRANHPLTSFVFYSFQVS